jgi:hypothetical protein
MLHVRSLIRLWIPAAMLTASACSDAPVAPAARPAPDAPQLGLLTWFYLPRGAQWALIFDSYSGPGSLNAKVYHYPTSPGTQDPVGTLASPNAVKGSGSFSISTPKLSGTLTPISAVGNGTCVPWGVPCDPAADGYVAHYYNGVQVIIPESATVTGTAVVNKKATKFLLILQSTQYPRAGSPPDEATLRFCDAPNLADPAACGTAFKFTGQLHHEPT